MTQQKIYRTLDVMNYWDHKCGIKNFERKFVEGHRKLDSSVNCTMFPARIEKYTLPKPKYRIYSLRKLKIDDREIYIDFFPKDVAVQACFNAMNWKSQCVTQSQVWSGLATYYLFLQAEKDFLRQHDRIFVVFFLVI